MTARLRPTCRLALFLVSGISEVENARFCFTGFRARNEVLEEFDEATGA